MDPVWFRQDFAVQDSSWVQAYRPDHLLQHFSGRELRLWGDGGVGLGVGVAPCGLVSRSSRLLCNRDAKTFQRSALPCRLFSPRADIEEEII